MYRIGMFSKLGRVTVKTLRYYDEIGLLTASRVDEESGYRYYVTDQLFRLNKIVALRQMGFSIPEISAIVDGHNIAETFAQRKKELTNDLQTLNDQLFRLNNYISEQKEDKTMTYQAVIKEIPACTVFAAEYTLPNYAALNSVMPALGEKVAKANPGIKCVEPDYCFNVYLDKEYRETDVHVEICQAVTSRGKDGDGVVFKDLPAVTVVSVLHPGSYEKLGEAYAYAIKWVEDNGYQIIDNIRESYIDGVWNKDNIEDWLTEIQVPVTK
ncbi:MAG: MerR family transcriptional regulator [Streptococcaceae bacterium]|jgi:DNA-binding transcriptional MerR regulator|nr:MerR family transcriptional regulator [Streptococcaceae bacterium]